MSKKHPAQKTPPPAPAHRWWESRPKGPHVLAIALAAVLVVQALSLSRLEWRFGQLQHSVGGIIDEVGSQMSLSEQLALFGNDLNEIQLDDESNEFGRGSFCAPLILSGTGGRPWREIRLTTWMRARTGLANFAQLGEESRAQCRTPRFDG